MFCSKHNIFLLDFPKRKGNFQMEIDRKVIAASSWKKNRIIEIYNSLFFREYFIKIHIFFCLFCKPCQRIYIMFFIWKTVIFLSFSYTFVVSIVAFENEMKNWRFICFDEWLSEWELFFLLKIHSIKLEFAVNLLNNTIRFSRNFYFALLWRYFLFSIFIVKIPYGSPSFLIICVIKNYINQIRSLTSRTFHFPQSIVLVCFGKFNFLQ